MNKNFIDVRDLIIDLSDQELIDSANAYWKNVRFEHHVVHKPFSFLQEAHYISRHLSLLFYAANLSPGLRILEIGCGAGWLSIVLAELGMICTGIDLSSNAIELANVKKSWHQKLRPGSVVDFAIFDGHDLLFEDAAFDRVIFFDAFHHVRDQRSLLSEISRVLRPGGRVAMCEPAPGHSRSDAAQQEMRKYKVIENDIDITLINNIISNLGLRAAVMLLQQQEPLMVSQESYFGDLSLIQNQIMAKMESAKYGLQCFYIEKPKYKIDSRNIEGLGGALEMLSTPNSSDGNVFNLRVKNTGTGFWLGDRGPGKVNLNVRVTSKRGQVTNLRFPISNLDIPPLEIILVRVPLAISVDARYIDMVTFDLVSEDIVWFSEIGACKPLVWHLPI